MQVVFLSDTHMKHERLAVPPCDLIVHAGDFCRRGGRSDTVAFLDWLAAFSARKVLVGGNWDLFAARQPDEMRALCAERDVHWLLDEEKEILGLRVYGAPWTPRFGNMAWNLDRGAPLRAAWAKMPRGLDLLVTHGPPHGILDRMVLGAHVGDEALREVVLERAPRLHVFGHIHEAHGETRVAGCPTRFLNVATSRLLFGTRTPVTVEL
jgi:predicted phosphodiesterase